MTMGSELRQKCNKLGLQVLKSLELAHRMSASLQ